MSGHELERAVAAMKGEQAEEEAVRAAAGRVFRRVFDATHLPDSVGRIRSCADFQALLPGYLSQTLTPSRSLLVRDHTAECVACRRALVELRQGGSGSALKGAARQREERWAMPPMIWALAAAMLLVGVAVGVTGARYGLLPWQSTVRATVASVEGKLYRVSKFGSALLQAGSEVTSADELRTAPGSRASLRLAGGGEVEMADRTDVSFAQGWQGTTVNLEQGRLIAQTVDLHARGVFIATPGVFVPVRRAVLSVDRGTKGLRVSLAQGSAEITRGESRVQLVAGQQMTTSGLEKAPIQPEFAWSKNAQTYLALLAELTDLQKQIENIPAPGLRYGSTLAKYVPGSAGLYAAIPNLGGTIAEAKRLFDGRLSESQVLRDWWQQQPASRGAEFDRLIDQVSTMSQYLGDEIVFSLVADGNRGAPLLLAGVRQPGLADYLKANVSAAHFDVITNAAELPAASSNRLTFLVLDQVLAASTDPAALRQAADLVRGAGGANLTATPFFARIDKSYQAGAEYLLAVDLNQVAPKSVSSVKDGGFSVAGNAQYLVLERRTAGNATDTRAALSFSGNREGVASWLGAPGPVGSLDFVSPEASFASSFVVKSPRTILQELMATAVAKDPAFANEVSGVESRVGVNLTDDVASPLGSDFTFAIDGPLLPIPSWRVIVEVNDPTRLQQTITAVVEHFNQEAEADRGRLQMGSEQVNGQTFYWVRSSASPTKSFYYTFVDGYLLAGMSEGDLLQAMQNRRTGHTLVNAAAFRDQLPSDSYTNFSGVIYVNARSSVGAVAEQLKSSGALTPQQQSVSALLANSGPGLICIYGQADQIIAASRGSFLGFNLGTLAGLQQGRPLLPLIASGAHAMATDLGQETQRQPRR